MIISRTNNIPNILFYEFKNRCYKMVDISKQRSVGEIMMTPQQKYLYINDLFVDEDCRNMGYGKLFLDFANKFSRRMGLNGKLRVMACVNEYNNIMQPHAFYRKYGFTSNDKNLLDKVDNSIKENKRLSILDVPLAYMYYPEY